MLIAAATTLAANARTGVVRLGPKTTVCKTYSSAVIARQIREGNLVGNPVPKDCVAYGLNSNVAVQINGRILSVSLLMSDGNYSDYWVGGDEAYYVPNDDNAASWGELFKTQVERCWKKPYGGIEQQKSEAAFAIRLKRDGTLEGMPMPEGTPATPYLRAYQESALRAIIECQPYKLPASSYEEWKHFAPVFTERKL